jgi:cytochrome c
MNKTLIAGALLLVAAAGPALAAGDPVAGEAVFKKCVACHSIGEGATNRVGPELNAVLGRTAGSLEGFNYSRGLSDAGAAGLIWTPETLVPWLQKPRDFVPGTKMQFVGIPNPTDIGNVIAYLATFSPDYVPPEPSPDPSSPASAPSN